MRCVERHIEQKRLLLRRGFIQKFQGKIALRVRGIKRPSVERLGHFKFLTVQAKCFIARKKITRAR